MKPSQSLICAVSIVLPVLNLLAVPAALGQNLCLESPVAVQILGSGGPFAIDARASNIHDFERTMHKPSAAFSGRYSTADHGSQIAVGRGCAVIRDL